jgi:hypothetical protein
MWFLSMLLPTAGPRLTLALIGAVLVASIAGLIFFAGVQHEHTKLVALDLQWRLKIEQANRDAENDTNARVQAALDAAAAVVPLPASPDRGWTVGLCDADPDCRNRQQQNVKPGRVPGTKARAVGH